MPEPKKTTKDMLGRDELTSVPVASSILLTHLQTITRKTEVVPLVDALNRICARDIRSPEDLPPCDRSTMDGYAVVSSDTFGASQSMPAYLNVIGEVSMGSVPEITITRGNCVKIPTGGILPDGADAVMMFEHTVAIDDTMIEIVKDVGSGANVIRRGDDIREKDLAVAAHKRLLPQDLGLLAGLGIANLHVFEQISVGIISTGDEIIEYTQPLSPGKIRNINSITIGSLVRQHNAQVSDYGIVSDDEASFFSTVEKAVRENHVVLFSGGSSVGMRDLGEQAISRLGPPGILIHGVALKPGKPIIIGLSNDTPIFGLPGHPVSAAVCFDLFVKPVIQFLSGDTISHKVPVATVKAILKRNINSSAGRLDIVRVCLEQTEEGFIATPVLGRSGAISSLSRAHGYFIIEEDTQGILEGNSIEVYVYQ